MPEHPIGPTRQSLHALGEHVLAAARHRAVGRIGLSVVPGGIATPTFGPDETTIGLIDGELIVHDNQGERRSAPTTLRAAGELVGITPGAPADVYPPSTPCELDAPLTLDAGDLARIVAWYGLVDQALRTFREEIRADEPSPITLWPEHFDDAMRAGDVNYGGLAGDGSVTEPYLYVGPSVDALQGSTDRFWNQPFGASSTWEEATTVDDALEFLRRGRTAAQALTHP